MFFHQVKSSNLFYSITNFAVVADKDRIPIFDQNSISLFFLHSNAWPVLRVVELFYVIVPFCLWEMKLPETWE